MRGFELGSSGRGQGKVTDCLNSVMNLRVS